MGLDNAGKTTFLEQIKHVYNKSTSVNPEKILPTVGMNIARIPMKQSSTQLTFWDLGGQTSLQVLWDKYFSECHCIVFVVDSTDPQRIEECATAFGIFRRDYLEKVITNPDIQGVPIITLCNKQDLPEHMEIHEIQRIFNRIAVKLEARDSKVMAVSALEGLGVTECVAWILDRVQKNSTDRPPRNSN